MTGWRLGWLIAPASVMGDLSKLVEYNTSCAPGFVQAAGEVALRDGESFVRSFVAALRDARDHLVAALRTLRRLASPATSSLPPAVRDRLIFGTLEQEQFSAFLEQFSLKACPQLLVVDAPNKSVTRKSGAP